MQVFVPFDGTEPKTRLSSLFDESERRAIATAMLTDVLSTLQETGREPTVLATSTVDCDAPVILDDQPLTAAVNDVLADVEGPVAIVMADLALLTVDALEQLFAPDADVVLAPGLGGGTNALVTRHPEFRVDYHGVSYRDHREAAKNVGADVTTIDSFRLAVDLDAPEDLAEVLVHGGGETVETLRDLGLSLTVTNGRVGFERSGAAGEPTD